METRIVFLEYAQPVPNMLVRLGDESSETLQTNTRGELALELETGNNLIQVYHNGEWRPQVVTRGPDTAEIEVDLGAQSGLEMTESVAFRVKYDLGERYVFEKIIGRGGMSVVVQAHDRLLNREVAIKLLSEDLLDDEEAQQIFLTEARSLATLNHPNLVAVHDITRVNGRVLLVIELVKGENLEVLVHDNQGLPLVDALRTCIQLVRVIDYLHDCGIVHRDIKPANVMVRNDGTVKLIDFGLARFFNELLIRKTRVRGTPAYMSPEQISGGDLTPSSDLYQLGITMFEIFSGQLPFGEGDIGYAHLHKQPPSIGEYVEMPVALAECIDQCLEKDPADRPLNGDVLLKALQDIYVAMGGDELPSDVSALVSSDYVMTSAVRRTTSGQLVTGPISTQMRNSGGSLTFGQPQERTLFQKITDTRVLLIAIFLMLSAAIVGFFLKTSNEEPGAASQNVAAEGNGETSPTDEISTEAPAAGATAEKVPVIPRSEPPARDNEPSPWLDLGETHVFAAVSSHAFGRLFQVPETAEVDDSSDRRKKSSRKKSSRKGREREEKPSKKVVITETKDSGKDSGADLKNDEKDKKTDKPDKKKGLMFGPDKSRDDEKKDKKGGLLPM